MKFLVIGLGSMGKRRVRCLKALGHTDIIGYDTRAGRREETEHLYGIQTIDTLDKTSISLVDAMIISVPPVVHID